LPFAVREPDQGNFSSNIWKMFERASNITWPVSRPVATVDCIDYRLCPDLLGHLHWSPN
jgi:hypothetical protein